MRYAVGKKVFEEYEEAEEFCKALMSRGVVSCIRETRAKATHRHLGDGMTESII